ncbi:MAG: hypothetical protein WDM89_06375 [Rhizomicrobium sp.]
MRRGRRGHTGCPDDRRSRNTLAANHDTVGITGSDRVVQMHLDAQITEPL